MSTYAPLPTGIASATRFRSVEPKPGEGEYDSEKTRMQVTVCRKPIGFLVESYWGYWHGEMLDGTAVNGDFGYGNKYTPVGALWRRAMVTGLLPDVPEPSTPGDFLRELAFSGQHGHRHTPASYIATSGYCSYYWSGETQRMDHPMWVKVAEVSARLRRFAHYRDEIKPQWAEVREIYYADNSTEVVEVNRHGDERQRMTAGPSGDACFYVVHFLGQLRSTRVPTKRLPRAHLPPADPCCHGAMALCPAGYP